MFDKRHRITLLFNANKAYDRQVVEGVGEYLQASQSEWDIFIEEDFRARIDNIKEWLGDGVIAVTDARARHVLQACEHLHIPVPEKLCVIGIDNEELTRYLSRVALSSVAQGARQMGYQAAKLLHRLLAREEMPLQRILVPPVRVIARRSTDYRSLTDPAVIQAMHFIRNHACKGIKVEQVLDAVGISRSNLEKRFKEEVGETIHALIHAEKLEKARSLLISTTLAINEISQMCGYPSLQYFYSVFKKEYVTTPKEYRDQHSEALL